MFKLSYQENNMNTANLYLQGRYISKVSSLSPTTVDITSLFTPERRRVEDFIKGIYKESYDAEISVDYPVLMSVRNSDGDILAAVGFRYADKEPLFLEQYTNYPIEKSLNCSRYQVVEIGNLASAGKGASIFLFAALAEYLNNKKIQYATITGTDFLHRHFEKMGLSPREICVADIASVCDNGQKWGSYYDTHPRVLVGSISDGVKRLKRALGTEFEDCRPRLYPRLHYKG